MKLFIFEGAKREPQVLNTLEKLFFNPKDTTQRIICCFNSNIYNLYQRYIQYGNSADIVSVLREIMQGREDNPFTDDMLASDFGEIYLFFDYDFHDKRFSIEEINRRISEMLKVFNNETDNGKLYISYPMIEALRYTKQLPDTNYINYIIDRQTSHDFKKLAAEFSFYTDGWDFLTITKNTPIDKYDYIKENWRLERLQNVKKANWLCNNIDALPVSHDDIAQDLIFKCQCDKYIIPALSVSILSAFALFLYDYSGNA